MLTTEQKKQIENIFYNSLTWGAASYLICVGASIAVNTLLESNVKSVGMFTSLTVSALVTTGMFKRGLNRLSDNSETIELVFKP